MEKNVIAAASSYLKKYYENPDFIGLPKAVRDEVKTICAYLADKTGGIAVIGFLPDGSVYIETEKAEGDSAYDEEAAKHYVTKIQTEQKELLSALSKWFMIFKTKDGKSALEDEFAGS